jgi:hypothetical protein
MAHPLQQEKYPSRQYLPTQTKAVNQFSELGPQIAVFRQRPLQARDLFSLYLPGGFLVLGPLAYGAYRANFAYTHFGPAAAESWARPWYIVAIIALFFLVLVALFWLRESRNFITIHQNGVRLVIPHPRSLRWDQIAGISSNIEQERFLGIRLRTRSSAIIYPNSGKPIQISSFKELPHLVAQLKAQLYPRLLPGLQEQFNSSQWLHFGPVSIQFGSCRIRTRQIPWEAVRQVAVRSGDLVVELENDSTIRLPASEIPNLEILLQIIQTGLNA